ncbi:MAG: adenylate/guanylate cyclase domain-containing protein [Bacteroidales bacterium]
MIGANNEELFKRISKLVRQKQVLQNQIRKLEEKNVRLAAEIEKLKSSCHDLSTGSIKESAGEKIADTMKFNMVTLLFAEIRGFPDLIEAMDSASVMDERDEILYEFDAIAAGLKTKRIKTIGDTFMCAGGIPEKNITNPVDVVLAALEMRNFLDEFERKKRKGGECIWELKTGIHTGPVIAGVSGKKKVSYDLKGDTVNNASRIETMSENGSILISVMTYELVKEFFDCQYYGKLPVKYKGELQTYRVTGIKPEFSEDGKGRVPNSAFRVKFGLIQFTDIQEMILDKLERELPGYLYYHNVKHTVDVVTEVELIGWAEGCTDDEILLLKTAGLFHDTGLTVSYENHEYHGTLIAGELLPQFNYTKEQIDRVCSIIMATRLPPKPSGLLEEIICDSDLDYLGRSDFVPVSNTLFEELKAQGKMKDINEWNRLQVKFISGHQYFTKTARSLREVNKQLQIERLQNLITG